MPETKFSWNIMNLQLFSGLQQTGGGGLRERLRAQEKRVSTGKRAKSENKVRTKKQFNKKMSKITMESVSARPTFANDSSKL